MSDIFISAPLTLKSDTNPHAVKLKVFWKTKKRWTPTDVAAYHKAVPAIAEKLARERYWDGDGDIKSSTFTCEDFAIRILCEYASAAGLPVRLATGVRAYRNMEVYNSAEHGEYSSTPMGFAHMAMLTYGAPDMQRIGINTVTVSSPELLLPGDVLAQTNDNDEKRAHHIQVVHSVAGGRIGIYQGNSGVGNVASKLFRLLGMNPANPIDSSYTGKTPEVGFYKKAGASSWNYENLTTGKVISDFLKNFQLFRWNFDGFNK
ncbi:hypothetical protein [Pseudogulbenkiania subflava]|uniref:Uncharacterized protein n=1 Tax=Pseudogulbenkiania subflava DSM 22618 TaxID=1123014 RepID=A0A1Y6BI69_9NEIS|nr:hypothetical protein [Pseudogulbenkiania subflava]SMF12606.1 hypothetical protein SAMN02745746_01433 [Pseudogulbenkiania subflava DSM 22618]